MAVVRLFVYGSLRSGGTNHQLMTYARLLGPMCTPPGFYYVVIHGDYLALIEGWGPSVPGELYEVSPEHIAALDVFEDVPRRYVRRAVYLIDGTQAEAYFKA